MLFDGAMGTMLQAAGMQPGQLPEALNMEKPELVIGVMQQYVDAGSQALLTNTFGANALKLAGSGYTVEEVIRAAVKIARAANPSYVVLDIGPTGQMLEPLGTLSFEEAYDLFAEQVRAGERAGADAILVETLSDLYEAKAAVLAAKENSDLPVICTMTFQEDGRTFMGCDPVSATLTLQGLGVDVLGVNCSLGPKELLPVVEKMLRYARVPIMVQPNAGIPREVNGATVFDISVEEYALHMETLLERGVRLIGGCCGTNPDFIRALANLIRSRKPVFITPEPVTAACSAMRTCIFDERTVVVGERINPSGNKRLRAALLAGKMDVVQEEAIDQTAAGADILDVNIGLPEGDETECMQHAVRALMSVTDLPLMIDSADSSALEVGARLSNGRPIVNSVTGEAASIARVLPVVKKYGTLVVGLAMDENGIPADARGRFAIAERIVNACLAMEIPKEDILIDCLTMTAAAQQAQARETVEAVRMVRERLGVKTILGVSNISYGLPNRDLLSSVFLSSALGAGLNAAIMNPLSAAMMGVIRANRVLSAEDEGAAAFIANYHGSNTKEERDGTSSKRSLIDCIIEGRKEEAAQKVEQLLKDLSPEEIIDSHFVPALNAVSERYDKGEIFLPQLMNSAAAVKHSFDVIKAVHPTSPVEKGSLLLATVEGDVHDIGKNIVKLLLENYGYDVRDLGNNVPVQEVVAHALSGGYKLVGLSALMTTTVKNMERTIHAIQEAGVDCKVMVGGAVLNREYAEKVGADYYAADAREGVRIAQAVLDREGE